MSIILNRGFVGVEPISKEVETGTETMVSCVVTGITKKLDSVVWTKDGTDVTSLSADNYLVSAGVYDSNSQTTTLTVKGAANIADSTYSCVITSDEHQETNKPTTVALNVFGKKIRTVTDLEFNHCDLVIALIVES